MLRIILLWWLHYLFYFRRIEIHPMYCPLFLQHRLSQIFLLLCFL
nr:MAG TPA_asm: hypothetical protein [Bacteriophage sp.]